MFRRLVARGTEPTPGARAQEAARLVAQFLGAIGPRGPVAVSGFVEPMLGYTPEEWRADPTLAQGFHIGRPRPLEELL